jgi:hypothetical protein
MYPSLALLQADWHMVCFQESQFCLLLGVFVFNLQTTLDLRSLSSRPDLSLRKIEWGLPHPF